MMKVIFLDRDGVVNQERGDYTWRVEDFVFNADVLEFCEQMANHGYQFVIITNQSGIGKGLYTLGDVEKLHRIVRDKFESAKIPLLDIYLCPHHPETGSCICRKPGSLLIEKAMARFEVNSKFSWMIGDRDRDCEAAEKAGIRSILIDSNSPLLPLISKIVQ